MSHEHYVVCVNFFEQSQSTIDVNNRCIPLECPLTTLSLDDGRRPTFLRRQNGGPRHPNITIKVVSKRQLQLEVRTHEFISELMAT